MNHTLKVPFSDFGENVYGSWAYNPGNTAIIFVHGFNGHAIKTWSNFPSYLSVDGRFSHCDIFYFGYDSLRQQINHSAACLFEFMNRIQKNNEQLFENSIGHLLQLKREKQIYTNIVIVAHSMGAVVARRALVHAKKLGLTWTENTKMVLFAPAHRGARVYNLLRSSNSVMNYIISLISFRIVTIDELKPGSPTLLDLAKDCEYYFKRKKGASLVAKEVISASKDNIVTTLDFFEDPPPIPLIGTHIGVCKPNENYKVQLNILAKHV